MRNGTEITERKKIDPEVNRARVKKCMEGRDRINVTLPKGTVDKIHSYGFAANSFARSLIIAELEKLDRMKK